MQKDSLQEYSQPSFYHFSQDSIHLAQYALDKYKHKKIKSILDIGCGCGVVALEYARNVSDTVSKLTFIEKQEEFLPHLRENIKRFNSDSEFQVLSTSFDSVLSLEPFDLVLSNPPFFLSDTGRPSLNRHKNDCHFFSASEVEAFFELLFKCKKDGALVLFLSRADQPFIQKKMSDKKIKLLDSFQKTSVFTIT